MKIIKNKNSIIFEEDNNFKTILPLNNILYVNNGKTFSFRTKNGRRLFSVKYEEITEPSSTSLDNLISILNGMFNEDSGGKDSCNLQEKSVDIIQNGQSEVLPDDGFDGLSKAVINVNVSSTGATVVNGRMYVTSMANEGFSAQQTYNSIQMPDDMSNVTSLANAFSGETTLEEIIFPSEMPNILSLASTFNECNNLNSVNVNAPIVTDMSYTYKNCSKLNIQDIKIPKTVVNMEHCFDGFGNNDVIIEEYILENLPNLTNVTYTFNLFNCAKKIILRNLSNLTSLDNCFSYCGAEEIDVSEIGLTDLGQMFTQSTEVKKIILPNNLQKINNFFMCFKLESIDLPSTLIQLPSFNACQNLASINGLEEVLPNITEGEINFSSTRITSLDLSKKNPAFIPTTIDYAFSNCDLLTDINLDNWDLTSTNAEYGIFEGCTSLKNISLNNSNFITYAKLKNALQNNGLQDQVTITPTYEPEGNDIEIEFNKELGNVFINLNDNQYEITETPYIGLSYILANEQLVTNINRLFADQVSLTKVSKIPSVAALSGNFSELFNNCQNLVEVNMSNSINGNIEGCRYWFNECPSLETIYMDGIRFTDYAYAENLFTNCSSLKTIYLRNSDETSKNKLTEFLTNDGLQDQVTIVTE